MEKRCQTKLASLQLCPLVVMAVGPSSALSMPKTAREVAWWHNEVKDSPGNIATAYREVIKEQVVRESNEAKTALHSGRSWSERSAATTN